MKGKRGRQKMRTKQGRETRRKIQERRNEER
jgi:hypothetical protein